MTDLTFSEQNSFLHHGIEGQKWGVRNGPPYPLSSDKLANKLFNIANEEEPQISRDLKDISKILNVKMHGLDNRLKTRESLNRKIKKDSLEKNISEFKAANKITDAVRYTFISDNKNFVNDYFSIKSELLKRGYKEEKCKNYFDMYEKGKAKHKQVTSVFKNRNNYKFEIQFQTPESQKAKDLKTPIYEERRKVNISKERAKQLEVEMDKLAEKVPYPNNIHKIKTY